MQKAVAVRSEVSLHWEKVDGAQVMRVWQVEGKGSWPQVALLRVPNTFYQKYSQDPEGFKKFVNEHNVFSKPVIVAGPWMTLSSMEKCMTRSSAEQKNDPGDWMLTALHGKRSTMIVAAVPQLNDD